MRDHLEVLRALFLHQYWNSHPAKYIPLPSISQLHSHLTLPGVRLSLGNCSPSKQSGRIAFPADKNSRSYLQGLGILLQLGTIDQRCHHSHRRTRYPPRRAWFLGISVSPSCSRFGLDTLLRRQETTASRQALTPRLRPVPTLPVQREEWRGACSWARLVGHLSGPSSDRKELQRNHR